MSDLPMSLEHIQLAAKRRSDLYMRGATPADANHLVGKLAEHVQYLENELRDANNLIAQQVFRIDDLEYRLVELRDKIDG